MQRVLLCTLLVLALAGCSSSPKTEAPTTAAPVPTGVTANSTPTDVANVALSIVQAGNQESFSGLIAAERVANDMQAITRGKSDFAEVRRDAVNLASKTIFRTIDALESPRITNETVDGERAKCMIEGTLNGNVVQRELFFVREGGTWKLVPSHR